MQRFAVIRRWNLEPASALTLAAILSVTAIVYLRCLANGFVYDDYPMIVNNHAIALWSFLWKSLTRDVWWFLGPETTSHSAYYRPLEDIWIGLSYHLFGLHPAGWHTLKILLHLAAVLLAFRAAQLLTNDTSTGLLAAFIFALMPVHAEAVVWATAIPEPLAAVFQLGALCLFIQRSRPGWLSLGSSLAMFALALLSHESAVVFPLLIAAYVFLLDTPSAHASTTRLNDLVIRARSALVTSAPFFALALAYLGLRAFILGPDWMFGLTHVKTSAAMVNSTLVIRHTPANHTLAQDLLTIPAVLVEYLNLVIFPWQVGPAHDVNFVNSMRTSAFVLPATILLAIAALGYLCFRRNERRALYLFCAVWWLVTLVPVLSLDQIVALVGDRYEYLPSFAIALFLADCAVRFARVSPVRILLLSTAGAALCALWIVELWRVQSVWRDDLAMFTRCVQMAPASARYHEALGIVLTRGNDLDAAARQLAIASQLAPDQASLHLTLGMLYLKMHHGNQAAREMEAYYRAVFNQKKNSPAKQHFYVEFK